MAESARHDALSPTILVGDDDKPPPRSWRGFVRVYVAAVGGDVVALETSRPLLMRTVQRVRGYLASTGHRVLWWFAFEERPPLPEGARLVQPWRAFDRLSAEMPPAILERDRGRVAQHRKPTTTTTINRHARGPLL